MAGAGRLPDRKMDRRRPRPRQTKGRAVALAAASMAAAAVAAAASAAVSSCRRRECRLAHVGLAAPCGGPVPGLLGGRGPDWGRTGRLSPWAAAAGRCEGRQAGSRMPTCFPVVLPAGTVTAAQMAHGWRAALLAALGADLQEANDCYYSRSGTEM